MFINFFKITIYEPLYNGLIALINIVPFDAGVVVILFTLIVKFVLFPLSRKAVKTQLEMKAIQPKLTALKEEYKDDQQQYAVKMLEMYKEHEINPFSTIFLTLIQIPIIISLYYVFLKSGLPSIQVDLLYSFVSVPETVNMNFLGLIDISQKSVILALFAAVSSFFQMKYSVPIPQTKTKPGESFKDDLARSMSIQMRYVFPIIVFFIAYTISGVIAIYWFTSNIFTIAQEVYTRKNINKQPSVEVISN
jgi:YidC/Oxa1 family membrane protein insertase